MRTFLKFLSWFCNVVMTGVLILCCSDILKKDLGQMDFQQAAAGSIFIGIAVYSVTEAWKGKTS